MSNMGSDGIFISTPVVNEKRGVLKVKCEVTNDSHESSILEVRSAIYSPQGKLLQTIKQKQKLKSGKPIFLKTHLVLLRVLICGVQKLLHFIW